MADCRECGSRLPPGARFCDQCGSATPQRSRLPLVVGTVAVLALVGILAALLALGDSGSQGQVSIAAGWGHTVAALPDGTVWAWGYNQFGQRGDGTTANRHTPLQVRGLTNVIAVAGGLGHSLALNRNGTVWIWGSVAQAMYCMDGPYGPEDPHVVVGKTPVQVQGLTGVTALAAGSEHNLILRRDGTVWAWGYNQQGQLGDQGVTEYWPTPLQVKGLTDMVAVAASLFHSLALRRDGTVWAWGTAYDRFGRHWDWVSAPTPMQVRGLTDVVAVSAGWGHSLALRRDGTVWAWGWNQYGQLGDGTTTDRDNPVQVRGLTDVAAVAAGAANSLALRRDGTVWAWGYNEFGQLGDGTTEDRHSPVQVRDLTDVAAVAAGAAHSLALRRDGTVWAWGMNEYGELGDGTTEDRHSPVQCLLKPGR